MTTEGKNATAEEAITKEALTRYQATTGPRLREIILSLIKHLHGFARDVRLTGDEYLFAMKLSGPARRLLQGRQAGIPRARRDARARNPGDPDIATEAGRRDAAGRARTVLPSNALSFAKRADIAEDVAGEPLYVSGRILAIDRRPVPNATINVWQSDGRGLYDVQGDLAKDGMRTRGQLKGLDGRYSFWTVVPMGYPVPNDGGSATWSSIPRTGARGRRTFTS